MGTLVLTGATSGATTLTPTDAVTTTVTFPSLGGTAMVSGNMPAFSAYANAGTSCASATYTKVAFQVKEFDTANAFDNTTNYRFQPTVAGYYQVNLTLVWSTAASGYGISTIFKNGLEFKRGSGNAFIAANNISCVTSAIIYLNGSTDYIEGYAYQATGGSLSTFSGLAYDYFQAVMVRAA